MGDIALFLHRPSKTLIKLNKAAIVSIKVKIEQLRQNKDPYLAANYELQEVKVYQEGSRIPKMFTIKELINDLEEIEENELTLALYGK